uniref:Aminotransferase-like plant mobile domain-containing protein n=1 Tax=Fagus sylvatica TaxID=28930 RepID=A0A2N9H778_FAGSY
MSDFDVLGTVGKLALPIFASFPIRIPADPDKFLAIREFHVVHGCVLFPTCPGSQINLLRVRKTLCASAATSVGKFRKFQQNLISSACFHARVVDVAPDVGFDDLGIVGKLALPTFQRYRPCTEASLGSQDMVLRTEAVGMFLMPRGVVSSIQFLVWSTVRSNPWSNLVNLGQTWSKFSEPWEMYPGTHFEGFWARWTLVGLGTARSNLGQTSVNPSQTWSTLVKLGQTLGNVSRTFFLGVFDAASPRRIRPAWSGLSRFACRHPRKSRGTPIDDQFSPIRPTGLETKFVIRVRIGLGDHPGLETETNRGRIGLGDHPGLETKFVIRMSDRGSGSGGHRRSDRLAKGKAVAYAPESSPDTDDEYDAMEDVRTRVDASLARDLQAEFDAEAAGLAPSAARAPPRPGVVIGRSAGPSETTRPSPQPSVTTGSSDAPPAAPRRAHTRSTGILPSRLKRQRSEGIPDSAGTIPEDYVAPGFRYPPHGGIRPRYPVAVEISDTPLLTNLLAHPSSLVRRCQEPPYSAGRGGWSEFSRLSGGFPVRMWCFIERFFHHTGTFHLSTCEMAVLPVDWSAILGIRFGGRAPPSEPIDGFEAREILGLADRDATEGTRRPSVRIRYLADVLRRDREEPPTELRYRQWAAYFIFSCFLGNDRSIVPTPIVGMFRDIDTLREYDWGALTYGFYIRGLRRYSRRESISFLGFWQFTVFWAFEHFPTFAPSRLPLASDPDFPLARRWDTSRIERMTTCTLLELRMTVDCLRDADIIFQPYSAALSQRPEVFRAVALSRLRLWIRTTRSWELLLGERTVRQLGDEAVVPVDPSPLMTIEDYIPRAPSDPYIAGVSAYPSLVREGVPYQEWFEQVSLGSLMSLHEVEGGRVMGGVAMDSHHIRSSGQIERLEGRDGQYADGGDTARGGDGADAEGFGFPGCRGDPSCCRRTEIRGAASGHGHYSCYRS